MRKPGHFSGHSLLGTLTSQNGRAVSVSAAIDIVTASEFEVSWVGSRSMIHEHAKLEVKSDGRGTPYSVEEVTALALVVSWFGWVGALVLVRCNSARIR